MKKYLVVLKKPATPRIGEMWRCGMKFRNAEQNVLVLTQEQADAFKRDPAFSISLKHKSAKVTEIEKAGKIADLEKVKANHPPASLPEDMVVDKVGDKVNPQKINPEWDEDWDDEDENEEAEAVV